MKSPNDRDTPPSFGVRHNDMNETEQRANGNGVPDAYDMQALIDAFMKLPQDEQSKRLLHLYLAIQGEDGLTRQDLADHKMDDRQEFNVINSELEYQSLCLDLIMQRLNIEKPERAPERPRRRE